MSDRSDMIETIFQVAGPMVKLDGDGRIKDANPSLLSKLNTTLPPLLDTPFSSIVASATFSDKLSRNFPEGDDDSPLQFIGLLRSLDLACECTAVRLNREGSGELYLLSIEPRPGQHKDRGTEEGELRRFLGHLSAYILKLDLDGTITYTSDSVTRRTGLDEAEIIGQHWSKFPWFTHEDITFNMVNEAVTKVIKYKVKQQLETKLRSIHGDDLTFVMTMTPVLDQNNDVDYLIIEGSDLTRLRFSEEKLLLFATAVTQSPYGIAVADLKGKILFVNNAWADMHEYRADELMGQPLAIFHTSEQMREDVIPFNEQLVKLGSYEGEVGHVTRSGKIIPTWMNSSMIKDSWGVTKGIVGMARDIGEQLRVNRELRQAKEDAEEASRVKSRFLANVSHEIRTPLNGIIGMTNLTLDSPLTPDQRENLSMASSSAHHLLGVINDILDLSRVEADQLELESIPFKLDTVLETTVNDLTVTAEYKNLELLYNVESEVPAVLTGDPHRLRQILTNLIGNAIKFTHKGEVLLRVRLERECRLGVCLRFSIIDTGIGIPPQRQSAIFDSFTQADDSISRHFGGSGLGTTIARDLVEMMGGRIWLVSPVNEDDQMQPGSAFHFTAVFGEPEDLTDFTPEPDPGQLLQGLHLLVIEANDTRRKLLRKLLENYGMKVSEAFTLEDAKRILGSDGRDCDFIFAGSGSPELDPRQIARHLHLDYGERKPHLIVSTPITAKLDVVQLAALGGSAQITRPIKVSTLLEIFINLVQGHRPIFQSQLNRVEVTDREQEPIADLRVPPPDAAGNSLNILVAEDNKVNQMLVRKLLLKKGYQVHLVGNGQEALQMLDRSRFDLLLLDIQMPVMDGFEVARHLKKQEGEGKERIKILALTAASMSEDRERCLAAGMDGYITKPVDAQELYRAIEKLLDS